MGIFDPNLNNLYIGTGNIVVAAFGLIFSQADLEIRDAWQLFLMILAGFFGLAMQMTGIKSLKYAKATTVTMIESLLVVHGFLGEYFIFGNDIEGMAIVGALLVVGSCLYISFSKEENRVRTRSRSMSM